ncbi:MAG: hypothetical protein JXB48_23990 [Candidatus Latescibacteria bacterium]|nr:hypothetical protein [Candidatus Latescibacterota bacterium]
MKNKIVEKKILFYEIIGFVSVILILWIDELFDIPHVLFGVDQTPVNLTESLFESVCVLILGISILRITYRYLKMIKYLEGFLPVCSYCKRIRFRNEWIPIEVYITDHTDAVFTHGFCPDCYKEYEKKILNSEGEDLQ